MPRHDVREGGPKHSRPRRSKVRAICGDPERASLPSRQICRRPPGSSRSVEDGRALWRPRRAREQRRSRAGRDDCRHDDTEWRSDRSDVVPCDSHVPSRRAAHAPPRGRRHHHDRVDLGPGGRRPDDLQRRKGGRDQPRKVAGAAAGARQHPGEQRRPRLDFLSRRIVAEAPAADPECIAGFIRRELPFGRFGRPRRSATSWPSSRRPGELDRRRQHRRRRLPEPRLLGASPLSWPLSPLDRHLAGWTIRLWPPLPCGRRRCSPRQCPRSGARVWFPASCP